MSSFINTSSSSINTPSLFSNVKNIIIYILVLLIVVFILYYVYIKFFTPKIAELYKPNNEKVPKWGSTTSSNEAEIYLTKAEKKFNMLANIASGIDS